MVDGEVFRIKYFLNVFIHKWKHVKTVIQRL